MRRKVSANRQNVFSIPPFEREILSADFPNGVAVGLPVVIPKNLNRDLRREVSQATKPLCRGRIGRSMLCPILCLTNTRSVYIYPEAQLFLVERFHISWSELPTTLSTGNMAQRE